MDVLGNTATTTIVDGLNPTQVTGVTQNVFGTFGVVIVSAVILTLTVYFIRKILNGANKGKARLR